MEKIFFEIPIYRCSPLQHELEMQKMKEKKDAYESQYWELWVDEHYHHAWNYNEIVGWLNLYFYYQLQIDYWFLNKKRINSGIIKKRFVKRYNLTEMGSLYFDEPSEVITEKICKHITESIKNHRLLKNRFIDFSAFRRAGSYLDWKAIHCKYDYYSK